MLAAAEQIADREMEFLAHNARFHCFLELGDGRGLDREIAAMADIADRIRQPFYLWHTLCLRVVRAILDARYADAEELAAKALELGRLRQSEYPTYVFQYAQLFAIRWAQGRLGELWPAVRAHGELFPWIPRWRDALAAAELGDRASCAGEVERHARGDFADVPRDGLWLLHLCALAEACVLIGDERRGRLLYELLLPHADRNAVSYTQQPFGPVALRLGMLAALLGTTGGGRASLRGGARALRAARRRGVVPRVLYEHARVLRRPRRAGASRRRRHSRRPRRWPTSSAFPGCSNGSRRSRCRRRRPRRPRPLPARGRALDDRLRRGRRSGCATSRACATSRSCSARPAARSTRSSSPGGRRRLRARAAPAVRPGLHSTPRRRTRIAGASTSSARSSRRRAAGATPSGPRDGGGDRRADEELAQAFGLGGRDRAGASPAERARVSVTKAIRSAIKPIGRHSPALASTSTASIHTGRFCSYAPPGELPPRWHL